MKAKVANPTVFQSWIDALLAASPVYGVQAKGDRFAFGPLRRSGDLRLDYDVTILPPKKYFQPPREVLLKFSRKGTYESVFNEEEFIVLGVHPYDMVAINQMDKIFSLNNLDTHYAAYRSRATVIVCDVETASETVFAGCMGNATAEGMEGFDILLTKVESGDYVVEPLTEKGVALAEKLNGAPEATASDMKARAKVWDHNRDALRQFDLKMPPEELPALLEKSYRHPVWAEKAELCYSCGSCNLVCPTCYCFTVEDELNWDLESGERVRHWDGCMLSGFAKVAGGQNFRNRREARYRHRYYRKGKYAWDMIGEIACVGCGRCITACTANIANPVEVFNRLLEEAS